MNAARPCENEATAHRFLTDKEITQMLFKNTLKILGSDFSRCLLPKWATLGSGTFSFESHLIDMHAGGRAEC